MGEVPAPARWPTPSFSEIVASQPEKWAEAPEGL